MEMLALGYSSAVEHSPYTCEALGLIPSTAYMQTQTNDGAMVEKKETGRKNLKTLYTVISLQPLASIIFLEMSLPSFLEPRRLQTPAGKASAPVY